jgi:hypothetical protein
MTSTSNSDSSIPASTPAIQSVPATVDSQGRLRTSKEQRRIILGEFERSGLSAVQFARQTGLKYSTLAGWLQRYRRSQTPGRTRSMRLLEAVVEQHADKLPLVLELPGGAKVEIKDVQQAALAGALLRTLAKPC